MSHFKTATLLCQHKKEIKMLLVAIRRVTLYRKDTIPLEGMQFFQKAQDSLQLLLKKNALLAEASLNDFHEIRGKLKKYGGDIYPQGFWTENAEVFLVAAIVAFSIRTFFFQPFQIPTNSMYPTYAGMTFEVFSQENPAPKGLRKFFRLLRLGASSYRIPCPHRGEVFLPLMTKDEHPFSYGGVLAYRVVEGRKWFGLLSTKLRSYRFYVRDTPIEIRVPFDFSLDEVVLQTLYPEKTSWSQVFPKNIHQCIRYKEHKAYFQTFIKKKRDEMLFSFDILAGDMLFVNRLCYHFMRPKVGDPFVFRTKNIPSLMGNDKYYIKRIVGQGGDTLKVQERKLLCNGNVLDNCLAFRKNNAQIPPYRGYTASGSLVEENVVRIPDGHFFAMGDNSPYSGDSRYWGPVPQKEVIGKACFIFYPFTSRWGAAR